MSLITIDDFEFSHGQSGKARQYCRQLEEGHILYFPRSPIHPSEEDVEFLLDQRQSGAHYHKNIAYRPHQERITGLARELQDQTERLLTIMSSYSRRATEFLTVLLAPYAPRWRLDYGSFRSQEEEGRDLRPRSRNDLIHVDAFPTRPTHGDRILRVFTNINPSQSRDWITTDSFEGLAHQFAGSQLPLPVSRQDSVWRRILHTLARGASSLGLPVVGRSPYDEFMLRFHHFLKENQDFQDNCPKQEWKFPPHSSWIVFTDTVSHAVMRGRFALEQTYIVSRHSLVVPEKAPVRILENLCGAPLID